MSIDWSALGDRLSDEIIGAVASASTVATPTSVSGVELIDVHVRDMLVLWPTIVVHHTYPPVRPFVVEGSRQGDLHAADVTSLGGPGGTRWDVVFARFHGALAAGCAAASRALDIPVSVAPEVGVDATTPGDIDEHVAPYGPLDYGPLAETLTRSPALDASLAAGLSADRVRDIDSGDVRTAIAAVESPWQSIRRHAAIVLLSAHL
ncbi:hypothetical protein [Gordonia terrae]